MKTQVLPYILIISVYGFMSQSLASNVDPQQDTSIEGQLPLTGDPRVDDEFKKKLQQLLQDKNNTEKLTKVQAKRFNDLNDALGLDQSDLRLMAKGLSAPKSLVFGDIGTSTLISPDNIRTMPLGASVWGGQSLFSRRSIFDIGILRGLSLIPDLQGSTESGLSSKVSSRTDKNSNSEKFSYDVGAALRLGGFQASVAFKHDSATEKTTMGGKATASIYNYATNTFRIEAEQGSSYRELRGGLKGANLGGKSGGDSQADLNEIFKYISVSEIKVNPDDTANQSTYKHVKVIKKYVGGSDQSARAHIQALALLENYFSELREQFDYYQSTTIRQSLMVDMVELKIAINACIKAFYEHYGDSFVTEITGYSEIQGQGQLIQKSGSANSEVNNAGSLTAGYSNFIWAAETSLSMSKWAKDASAYGASEVSTTIYQRPNNGVDLSAYNTALVGWLNTAIKENGNAAALPAVAIQPTLPKVPTTRPWQDDPFAPPKEVKEWKDWKESREAFKDSKFVSVPDWIKRNRPDIAINQDPVAIRQSLANAMVGGDGRQSNSDLFFSFLEDYPEVPDRARVANNFVDNSYVDAHAYRKDLKPKTINDEYNNLQYELRALKVIGKKQRAAEKKAIKNLNTIPANRLNSSLSTALTSDDSNNELVMDKMLVSGFKTLPFSAVLEALRPNLDIPVSIDANVDVFANTTVLLGVINKFNTIDTYINFIASIPESGLQRTSIPANFHKYVSHLEDTLMPLVQGSMSSGRDIALDDLVEPLIKEVYGISADGRLPDPKSTLLYKYLNNNSDYYSYIIQLTTNDDNFRVVASAPGGYLPIARRSARYGGGYCMPRLSQIIQLGIRTTYNLQPRHVDYSECIEISSSTDMAKLLSSHPQTPLYPLYIYAEKTAPMLNFVQFVGGSRLVIGRDITLVPPGLGDLTQVPSQGIPTPDPGILASFGYKASLLGDADRLKSDVAGKCDQKSCFSDERLQNASTLNAFLSSDLSWNYSLWFQDNDEGSMEGYERNQLLIARIGMYVAPQKFAEYSSDGYNDYYGRGSTPLCITGSYCPVLTYQFMAPYSYQLNYALPNFGLGKISLPPKDSYLAWSDGKKINNKYSVSRVSLSDVGNSVGTKYTGGLLMLYPITNAMLAGAGAAGFTYSSGSSPKDIFSQDDDGNSPFDSGFTRALLER